MPAEAQDGIAPPLPRRTNRAGEAVDEGQLLEIGLYGYWWDEEQGCWLTNWPAGEDWDGAEYARNRDGSVAGPFVPDLEEDEWGQPLPPLEERWARTRKLRGLGLSMPCPSPAAAHIAEMPPSSLSSAPVMKRLSSLAR